ncbi:hypothetical protein ACH4YO_00135 [Streptomyces noursei]|uniref:hypothetical protein n=1 Tax=Streptomyces noursei TaxID=1971 RepID=UPI0033F449BB
MPNFWWSRWISLGGLLQQNSCGARLADRGLLVQAEDLGEVGQVGAVDEGFFELPVDAESLQGGGLAAKGFGEADTADRAGAQGCDLVDQQVRVGGVRPAVTPELQPLAGDMQREAAS